MHLYASKHKVHAVAFCRHVAFWRTRILTHGCYIGTPSGTPAARPAHVRPCFALSPLGFSCVSMCDPTVRCILAHSDAFMCIHVCPFMWVWPWVRSASLVYVWTTSPAHLCAFVRILTHSNVLLCILTHHEACIKLSSPCVAHVPNWEIRIYAHKRIIVRMH